jgi:hypothetical protein
MITNNFWRMETYDTLRRFHNGALMDSVKDIAILFLAVFLMVWDLSLVLIAIFVMSNAYCRVLDIKAVEFQKKDFQLHRIPPQVRKSVEKVIFSAKSSFQSLSHSEFTSDSEFFGLGRFVCIEYCLNSSGDRTWGATRWSRTSFFWDSTEFMSGTSQ